MTSKVSSSIWYVHDSVTIVIDIISPSIIAGWGFDSEQNNGCDIEIIFDEITIATIKCNEFRQDLKDSQIADGNCGFSYSFPKKLFDGKNHSIAIKKLGSSTIIPGTNYTLNFPNNDRLIRGNLECVDQHCTVSGWAWDVTTNTFPQLDLVINGKKVNFSINKYIRPDLIKAKITDNEAGFKLAFSHNHLERFENTIEVQANGVDISGSPKNLQLNLFCKVNISISNHGVLSVLVDGLIPKGVFGVLYIDGNEFLKENSIEGIQYFALPPDLKDGKPHSYQFEINDSYKSVWSDVNLLKYPNYKFCVEHVNLEKISGWLHIDELKNVDILCLKNKIEFNYSLNTYERKDVEPSNNKFGFCIVFSDAINSDCELQIVDTSTGVVVFEIRLTLFTHSLFTDVKNNFTNEDLLFSKSNLHERKIINFEQGFYYNIANHPKQLENKYNTFVTVIIPVYSDVISTIECVSSVIETIRDTPHRAIIINDCTPEKEITDYLECIKFKFKHQIDVITCFSNGGFSRAVNIGMICSNNDDVILLNSDTMVHGNWIDRLRIAAHSESNIGTVTPFSNNGEIVSIPVQCKSSQLSSRDLLNEIDSIAKIENKNIYKQIPVGVGFCMYIKRKCILEVGYFDAETWGRGYGEEVDFCLKASCKGWKHMLASDIFVMHKGETSFKDEKIVLMKRNQNKISEIYPFFDCLIQHFISACTIRQVRRRVCIKLLSDNLHYDIMHISHDFGGGTQTYYQSLSTTQKKRGLNVILLTSDKDCNTTLVCSCENSPHEVSRLFNGEYSEIYKCDEVEELIKDIRQFSPSKVHLHSTLCMTQYFIDQITKEYNYCITVHDYSWVCPRVTLTAPEGAYCGDINDKQNCLKCIETYGVHIGVHCFFNRKDLFDLCDYVHIMREYIFNAKEVYIGSRDVKDRLLKHDFLGNFIIEEYPDCIHSTNKITTQRNYGPIRVATIGALSLIKGYSVLFECAEYSLLHNLPLAFIIVGYTCYDSKILQMRNVTITGKYNESSLYSTLATYNPDISFFPSRWPETFSYTLSRSFSFDLWPVASNIGAIQERILNNNFGTVYDINITTKEICELLINVGKWRRENANIRFKNSKQNFDITNNANNDESTS